MADADSQPSGAVSLTTFRLFLLQGLNDSKCIQNAMLDSPSAEEF